ncbi:MULTISPECIES: Atu4866 domain-containing protein [unclassified Rhizobium]|uniref:Atu4866 domain-containing protein n=1 Tax=unclassified Rhizobium TaxID=2613769 RepID=UPI0009E89C94|nr:MULTISPECIES: Atu4866 domain-containing protein [unclassified Rhizobium]
MKNFLPLVALIVVATATAFGALAQNTKAENNMPAQSANHSQQQNHPYVGMWVTDDGRIRHELLPNGRYDEARGNRESAYQGLYVVTGNQIDYWDDTGFTADGVFVDENTLHHAGMILRRK